MFFLGFKVKGFVFKIFVFYGIEILDYDDDDNFVLVLLFKLK